MSFPWICLGVISIKMKLGLQIDSLNVTTNIYSKQIYIFVCKNNSLFM